MKKNYIKEFNIFLNKEKNAIKTIRKAKKKKKFNTKDKIKLSEKNIYFYLD